MGEAQKSEWTEIHPDSIGVFIIVEEALTHMAPGIKPAIRRGISERIARRVSHELMKKEAARKGTLPSPASAEGT